MHRVRIPQAFLQARPLPASSNRLDSDSVTIWMGKNTAKSTGPKLGSPRCCTTPPEAASLLKAAYHRPWGCSQQPPYVLFPNHLQLSFLRGLQLPLQISCRAPKVALSPHLPSLATLLLCLVSPALIGPQRARGGRSLCCTARCGNGGN